jgi:oligoendopeptidase F
MTTTLPSWDLSQYYSSHTDPKIDQDLADAKIKIQEFEQKYRGKVASLSPTELFQAIKTDEDLSVLLGKPGYYLSLSYEAGGSEIEAIQQKMISVDEQTTHIANLTTFFGVELSKRPDLVELSKSSELAEFSYYLERLALNAKYVLSEEVENVLSLKDLSGSDAWGKFFRDLTNKIEVQSDIEGELKTYRETDLSNLMKHRDRNTRQKAFEMLAGEMSKLEPNSIEALNNLILDHKIDDNLRGFTSPQESSLVSNQINQKILDSLINSMQRELPVFQKYTKLKSEILQLDKLEAYDIYAEINFKDLELPKYTWDKAQAIILEAFGEFNPKFREIAKLFFDNNWIDADDRPQKQAGAFCSSFAPGFHPVILCTYKDKFEDVLTVAHELGHGIHSYLTQEKQGLINSNYTLSTAEIASLCCETVVFDSLIKTIEDPRLKLELYANKIEEEAGNIFIAGLGYYGFEKAIHDYYREHGPLSKEVIRDLWVSNRYSSIFGDILNPTSGTEFGWLRINHFTYIFYNYVYASGLLTSSSIYSLLQKDRSKIDDYVRVLELGGSMSPVNILKHLGLNIEDPKFWDLGLELFSSQVSKIEAIWEEVKVKFPR